jgi:hypothetical protein
VLISGTYLAIRANLAPDRQFNSQAMLAVMVGFLLFLLFWVIRFVRHFQNVPARPN